MLARAAAVLAGRAARLAPVVSTVLHMMSCMRCACCAVAQLTHALRCCRACGSLLQLRALKSSWCGYDAAIPRFAIVVVSGAVATRCWCRRRAPDAPARSHCAVSAFPASRRLIWHRMPRQVIYYVPLTCLLLSHVGAPMLDKAAQSAAAPRRRAARSTAEPQRHLSVHRDADVAGGCQGGAAG